MARSFVTPLAIYNGNHNMQAQDVTNQSVELFLATLKARSSYSNCSSNRYYSHTGYPVHNSPIQSESLTLTHSSPFSQGYPAQGSSHSQVGHPSDPVLYPYSQIPAQRARAQAAVRERAPVRAGRGRAEHCTEADGPMEPWSLLPSESTHLGEERMCQTREPQF